MTGMTVSKTKACCTADFGPTLFVVQDMRIKAPVNSCRNGVPVNLLTASGSQVPAKLTIHTNDLGEDTAHVVAVQKLTNEEVQAAKRLTLLVDNKGAIVSASSPPATLFGFKADHLVGRNLSELLDVLHELKGNEARLTQVLEAMYMR